MAELDVTPGQQVRWRSAPPVVLRRTGDTEVHLVQAAGGPLGGDDLALRIHLAAGTELTVRSAAATVVQPGPAGAGPARWSMTALLEPGARLHWRPEPSVICDGADLHTSLRLALADGASALVGEEVLLGRHGEPGGRYRGELAVDHAGTALVRHTTVLDGADPGLTGPAGTGGYRAVAALFGVGDERPPGPAAGECPDLRWARHRLAGSGWLLLAVGMHHAALCRLLDADPVGSTTGSGGPMPVKEESER